MVESTDKSDGKNYGNHDQKGTGNNEQGNIGVSKIVRIKYPFLETLSIKMHELFPYIEMLRSMGPERVFYPR